MTGGDEELSLAMKEWYRKEDKKRKIKNGIKKTIAYGLLLLIWIYSAYLIAQAQLIYYTTDWYEVEAYCAQSAKYERDDTREECVNGERITVRDKQVLYSNTFVYTAKDGKEYTATRKGTTTPLEGSSETYLVDEENPAHAIPDNGNRLPIAVVLIIAGGMTFCILMTLCLTLEKPSKDFQK